MLNDDNLIEPLESAVKVFDEYFCDYLGYSQAPMSSVINWLPNELRSPDMGEQRWAWEELQKMRVILARLKQASVMS